MIPRHIVVIGTCWSQSNTFCCAVLCCEDARVLQHLQALLMFPLGASHLGCGTEGGGCWGLGVGRCYSWEPIVPQAALATAAFFQSAYTSATHQGPGHRPTELSCVWLTDPLPHQVVQPGLARAESFKLWLENILIDRPLWTGSLSITFIRKLPLSTAGNPLESNHLLYSLFRGKSSSPLLELGKSSYKKWESRSQNLTAFSL